MEASIVDLRYKTKQILKALERNEKVLLRYHGKPRGLIVSTRQEATAGKIEQHPFFGMTKKWKKSVGQIMQKLRGGRYRAL